MGHAVEEEDASSVGVAVVVFGLVATTFAETT
jgi:hypothetical protein